MKLIQGKRGFTLIELLVVIAIIGILTSIILPNLTAARAKSRDGRRISDVKQIQLALEAYAEANSGQYPAVAPTALASALVPTYMGSLPTDPSTGNYYSYVPVGTSGSCYAYHIGASLETADTTLYTDSDTAVAGSGNTCGVTISTPYYDFSGLSYAAGGAPCNATAGNARSVATPSPSNAETCYDQTN